MTVYYVDTDGSGASAPYATWATAAQTLDTISAIPWVAGDVAYCQGAAADSAAGTRTIGAIESTTTVTRIIGVKNGTTNAPPVSSDLCARAGADHYVYQSTDNKVTISGTYHIHGFKLISNTGEDIELTPAVAGSASECIFQPADDLWLYNRSFHYELINCEIDFSSGSSTSQLYCRGGKYSTVVKMIGGVVTFHATQSALFHNDAAADCSLIGVDLSGQPSGCDVHAGGTAGGDGITLINCSMGATYSVFSSIPSQVTVGKQIVRLIGCNSTSTLANDATYQDYEEGSQVGTIDNSVITRSGGASDQTTANTDGAFSYAMVATASAVLEGTNLAVDSPWLRVWVAGGSAITLTVYIANSSASTDYQEDEVRCVFLTPSAGDTSKHDFNPDPPNIDFFGGSTTAITDDTGSAWDTGANNHQKFSTTVTPGYTGWAYARVTLAKREASPTILYLDPRIIVT